jgi:hypothetical protein
MSLLNRRGFLGASIGAVSTLQHFGSAFAAQCVTGGLPAFLPNRLTVSCASRQNFRLFRQNTAYFGLAGVVNMTFVRGNLGTYEAGNLFLFPWLKPTGLSAAAAWPSVVPTSATSSVPASPIRGSALPQDEYFCSIILKAPTTMFIGFGVDDPFNALEASLGLYSNVSKLADGKPLGIDWASANLNAPWFGGSRAIPDADVCAGAAWRKLIVDALNQASVTAC